MSRFTLPYRCVHLQQVRWQGRDAEGRPILVVRVAQACQECSSSRAEALGHAVLSHVRSTFQRSLAHIAVHTPMQIGPAVAGAIYNQSHPAQGIPCTTHGPAGCVYMSAQHLNMTAASRDCMHVTVLELDCIEV